MDEKVLCTWAKYLTFQGIVNEVFTLFLFLNNTK